MKTVGIRICRAGTDQAHDLMTDDECLDDGDEWPPINVSGWERIVVSVKRVDDDEAPAYFWLGDQA